MSQTQGVVVAETKVITRLTIFMPRKQVQRGDKVVDESKFLGSFMSASGVLWLRLAASQNKPNPRSPSGFDSQWGRLLAFKELAVSLVNLLAGENRRTGKRHISINAHATLQVINNTGADGKQYTNLVWQVYGYEYGDQFFTTKKGILAIGPITRRAEQSNDSDDTSDLFAAAARDGGIEQIVYGQEETFNGRSTNFSLSDYEQYDQPGR